MARRRLASVFASRRRARGAFRCGCRAAQCGGRLRPDAAFRAAPRAARPPPARSRCALDAGAALESHRDRRERARSHAGRRRARDRVFGEQLGPGRSSRAMAIVHIAIFEAVNAIDGRYRELPAAAARAERCVVRRRGRAGCARHAGRTLPVAARGLRRAPRARTSPPIRDRQARLRGVDSADAPPRDPRAAPRTTAPTTPSRSTASTGFPSDAPGGGGRIRSASRSSRSARSGERCGRS